jgi:hypothetical protein
MSEAQEQIQEDEIDIDALQKHIEENVLNDEPETEQTVDAAEAETEKSTEDVIEEEVEAEEPEFDLDQALDSSEPIDLEGKLTEEEAREKAIARGWREDGVDKYGHKISAIEFLERAPFFKKIDLMRGDIDNQREQIKKLIEANEKVVKKTMEEREQHASELKAAKEKLLENEILDKDDINQLREIDKQLEEHTEVETTDGLTAEEQKIVNNYNETKDRFQKDNEWYGDNRPMTALADQIGTKYVNDYQEEHGQLPDPNELFEYVIEEVKKDFPDMGKPQRQTRVATNTRRTVTTNRPQKKTIDDLPEEQRAVAREVMEMAGLSEEEYLKTYQF